MVLVAPTLPGKGLSHACSVYGASLLVLPDASLDAVSVRALAVHAGRDQPGAAVRDGVGDRHARRAVDDAVTDDDAGRSRPNGATAPGVGPWDGAAARRSALRPGPAARRRHPQRRRRLPVLDARGDHRRHRPRAGTRCTSRSRTSATTPTSAPSSGPPTRSPSTPCTSSGRRRWNRRGAMVTDRYQRLRHHDTTAELLAFAADAGLDGGRGRQRARVGAPRADPAAAQTVC